MSNAGKITIGKIFEGCKNPKLIDSYIRGQKEAHTNQTLQELKEKVEGRVEKLDEKINKLNLSANPDDWILANGTQQVKMGVHSVITLIDEAINE